MHAQNRFGSATELTIRGPSTVAPTGVLLTGRMASSSTEVAKSARSWCGTLNNPSKEEGDYFKQQLQKHCLWWIVGEEGLGEGKTPHYQWACTFERAKNLNFLKANLSNRAHCEIQKGTIEQNRVYCMKENKFEEGGCPPVKQQGKRTDIELAVESLLQSGGDVQRMAMDHPEAYVKYSTNFEKLGQRYQKRLRSLGPGFQENKTVIWIYGATGVGKTKYVHESENIDDLWVSGRDLRWWQSYDMEEAVLFDDFRGDFCKYHELLRILDRYQITVENKGGSVSLQNVKRIWITSCFHPRHVYDTREDIEQLIRRIDRIVWFGENGIKTDVTNEKDYPGKPGESAAGFLPPPVLTRARAVIPETPPSQMISKSSSTNGMPRGMIGTQAPPFDLESDEE